MVVCLLRGADLHMAQRIPLPLTVSCSSKIQIGFTFLVPAHPGSPGERAVKWMCVTKNISADSWKCFNKVFVFYWQYNTQLHCIHKQCLSHYNTCSVGLHMVLV